MSRWKTILRWASTPLRTPQRTIAGMGAAAKTATVGAGVTYVGWEALVNKKPVMETVGEALVGEETNEAIKEGVHGTVGAVADTVGATKDMLTGAADAVSSLGNTSDSHGNGTASWGGIGEFFRNLTGGNGLGMMGNLLGNIFSGRVSMLSMAGLVASGLLLFGRFGWLGKIAGALLGMMLIGNNSRVIEQAQPRQASPADDRKPAPPADIDQPARSTVRR